ncbi:hypothetical protein [Aminobacterium sp. UBA4987]|uniref:hypothetical protein n=2 Tax=Aminobacterium TaxID=81466 RepID=UPI00257C5C03|nr:hypothetical protein [Aminobacterium sp. UBA4987]
MLIFVLIFMSVLLACLPCFYTLMTEKISVIRNLERTVRLHHAAVSGITAVSSWLEKIFPEIEGVNEAVVNEQMPSHIKAFQINDVDVITNISFLISLQKDRIIYLISSKASLKNISYSVGCVIDCFSNADKEWSFYLINE